jgi:hypothetical protein
MARVPFRSTNSADLIKENVTYATSMSVTTCVRATHLSTGFNVIWSVRRLRIWRVLPQTDAYAQGPTNILRHIICGTRETAVASKRL